MLNKIGIRIEKELCLFLKELNRLYSLKEVSPVLFENIREFIARPGKRVRPILFVVGYLGFSRKTASGLYRSALSLELLHDFMLIHDDIIDKSDLRRGKPSMHHMLAGYIKKCKNIKFSGQDLAIVAADVMYALAIDVFLSVDEEKKRKEKALRQFIQAAIYTGSGEFIELLYGAKNMADITKSDIYKIYDCKTAYYTFAYPLTTGAILSGAGEKQIETLFNYGKYLGRAFQIKDDILGMFGEEKIIGKSTLCDLQEAKKTILIWYAYRHASVQDRNEISGILSKKTVGLKDLLRMRALVTNSGSLDYAKKEVRFLLDKARTTIAGSKMMPEYKEYLYNYSREILKL